MKYSRIPYNHSETPILFGFGKDRLLIGINQKNINKEMEDEYVWIEFRKPEILWRVLFGDEFRILNVFNG